MNGLLTQASPSRRPKKRGAGAGVGGNGGGGGDGSRPSKGASGRFRGRGKGSAAGGSPLAFASSIDHSHLSPSPLSGQPNGEEDSAESADESESSRQQRFKKVDHGNQYEQVLP
jgi:hypothetical protein